MCGIFGLIRNDQAPHPERATTAFVELGMKAVERGLDSAGFALVSPGPNHQARTALHSASSSPDTIVDNVRIIKGTQSFTRFWNERYLPLVNAHRVVLGHTRWATQGDRDAMVNASPMITGSLVGTHNGDVNTKSVLGHFTLPLPIGRTDTEVLYGALNRDRRDRRKITEVLRQVQGRAALAWVDRNRTDRVYLARAALSPLALAWDSEGNLYYASNPRWFREIDQDLNYAIGFRDITLVKEGTLLTVNLDGAEPDIEDMRDFIPQCRASDARLSDGIVWRGFDPADCAADKAQQRHSVAAPTYTSGSKGNSGGGRSGGWTSWASPKTTDAVIDSYPSSLAALPAGSSYSHDTGFTSATNADDPFDWSEDLTEDEKDSWAEDEAIEAADRWFSDGASPEAQGVIRSASMPSEKKDLMKEYDLSTEAAFHKFQALVASWDAASVTN